MIFTEHDIDDYERRRIPSPGVCIYCGDTGGELTEEHVIPYALAANVISILGSCCVPCQRIIQPYEQEVLGKQLRDFRAMVEAPTRNKKMRPTAVRLRFEEVDDSGEFVRDLGVREVPLAEAPLMFNLWQSPPPRILGHIIDPEHAHGSAWSFVEMSVAEKLNRQVMTDTGSNNVRMKIGEVNRLHYLRFLAKTAHAYAAAELGPNAFEPMLIDLILNRSDDVHYLVGDCHGIASLEGPTPHTFKMSLGKIGNDEGTELLVVYMQLYPELGSPPHFVVVGKPLIDTDDYFEKRMTAA